MYKKLRRKIMWIEIMAFLLVMIVIVGAININLYRELNQNAHELLTMLAENNGKFPEFSEDQNNPGDQKTVIHNYKDGVSLGFGINITEETQYSSRYFMVNLDENGNIIECDFSHIAAVSEDNIDYYIQKALNTKKAEGKIGDYYYLKVIEGPASEEKTMDDADSYKTSIYFLDCYVETNLVHYILFASIIIAGSCLLVVSVIVFVLSGIAIQPMVENYEKQKRFITDAGHELRTPLTAISTNVDVLELISGKNEITEKIKRQIHQLSELINEMLTLSRMDAGAMKIKVEEYAVVNLTELLQRKEEEFKERIEQGQIKMSLQLKPNQMVRCIPKNIERLISVLIDNAIKYCQEGGEIRITLNGTEKRVFIAISNSCEPIAKEELPHLFDRFYRSDKSRSRETGGYGIGLSIAKAIVTEHRGSIVAENGEGTVTFKVILPKNK